MGRNNTRNTSRPGASAGQPPPVEQLVVALASVAVQATGRPRSAVANQLSALSELGDRYPGRLDQAAQILLNQQVRAAWEAGWQPIDLTEHAARRLADGARTLLTDAIAAEHAGYAPATIAARWLDQLAALDARIWWAPDRSHLSQWLRRHGVARAVALETVITLAGFLLNLPRLPLLLPLPGAAAGPESTAGRESTAGTESAAGRAGVDEKVLSRIRALLAKAESTEFPEEAEALSGKAQELMAKFSLDRALVEAETPVGAATGPTARRIWVEAPYVSAKTHLVHSVAAANRCRTVCYDKLGFITVLGDAVDLQLVEILATSLLLQASRAMLNAGSRSGGRGRSRTRSFRQSFLISYSVRIGERLREAAQSTEAAFDQAEPGRLLPVLAKRTEQVDALFATLFPNTVRREVSITNAAGWAAGRTAADLATLGAHQPVGR